MLRFVDKVLLNKENQLILAARRGDEKALLTLLNNGTNVNYKVDDGGTALHHACCFGHLHIVKLLLERGAELEAILTTTGNKPLHIACYEGHLDIVKNLLNRGANIEATQNKGATPLIFACKMGHLDVVKFFLDQKANLEATNNNGSTPLHWVCALSHFDVVKELLKRGANVNAKNNSGYIPSAYAKTDEIRKLFSDINKLFKAARSGDEKTVLKLLNDGANVNSKLEDGGTPLHNACYNGHLHIVKLLLDRGAELEAIGTTSGRTPLHNACSSGHLEVVKYLLDRGANIEARNNNGKTPLIFACEMGHLDVVKFLLDQKANLESRSNDGSTPLHWACYRSHFDVVKGLLKRGANVNAKDNNGKTPSAGAKTDEIHKLFSGQNMSTKGEQNDKASPFYKELFKKNDNNNHITLLNIMDKLSQLVGDVHEMKILYTMAMYCMRMNVIDLQVCKKCIGTGLIKTAETCTTEDAIVIYKIILKKANKDNIICDSDFFRFDNRAEVKRMSEADFIKDMKTAIELNTQRINNLEHRADNLEHRADKMQNVICNVVEHIKYQRKIQAAVGFISGIVNAFSFGVGGSLLKAFSKLTSNVVDFGDVEHIKEEIQVIIEHPDGTQEVTTGYYIVDDPGKELEAQFLMGVQMGAQMLSGQLMNNDFDKTLSAMTALGSAAALASNGCIENNNNKKNNESQTTGAPIIFPDAVLSEEDENKFLLHCAVKYGDIEEIKKAIASLAGDINKCDSQGRTALDLAALTGQLEVIELISDRDGNFQYGPRPKMIAMAKKREPDSKRYLE